MIYDWRQKHVTCVGFDLRPSGNLILSFDMKHL